MAVRPTLDELKRKCFKQSIDPSLKERYRRSWGIYYALYVTHFFSIRIVRWLYPTSVKPNQITYLSYVAGLGAVLCFATGSGLMLLTGAFLFEFFYILDAVDGQLARAKDLKSIGGAFLDDWGTFIIPPFVVFAVGLNPHTQLGAPWLAFLGAMTVLAIPVIELLKVKYFPKPLDTIPSTSQAGSSNPSFESRFLKGLYSALYRSCTMPVVLNLVTLATLLTLFGVNSPFVSPYGALTLYFAIVGTGVWVLKGIYSSEAGK